jgi:chromosome segregation ATPase
MDVITSLQNAIGIAGRIREISKNVEEAEFKNLLADLFMQLADAKLEVVNLKEQLADLRQKVADLERAKPETKEKPAGVKWGCYHFEGDEHLYCTACYDTKGQKILTTRANGRHRLCNVCQAVFSM